MDAGSFLELDTASCAAFVQEKGEKVCVFWVNGTRRWFQLECKDDLETTAPEDIADLYSVRSAEELTRCIDLIYAHGIHTIIIPALVPGNMLRGNAYMDNYLLNFVERMVVNTAFRGMLERYQVRVFGYGEMADMLDEPLRQRFVDAKSTVEDWTAGHRERRLFFGFCATDSANAALIALQRLEGEKDIHTATRQDLIRAYYGDVVERVHMSIAHGRMSAHSTPFMMAGEDLYFMLSPSFYFDERTLRLILFDHLVARRISDLDYAELADSDWHSLRDTYRNSRHTVLGVGYQPIAGKVWSPMTPE